MKDIKSKLSYHLENFLSEYPLAIPLAVSFVGVALGVWVGNESSKLPPQLPATEQHILYSGYWANLEPSGTAYTISNLPCSASDAPFNDLNIFPSEASAVYGWIDDSGGFHPIAEVVDSHWKYNQEQGGQGSYVVEVKCIKDGQPTTVIIENPIQPADGAWVTYERNRNR